MDPLPPSWTVLDAPTESAPAADAARSPALQRSTLAAAGVGLAAVVLAVLAVAVAVAGRSDGRSVVTPGGPPTAGASGRPSTGGAAAGDELVVNVTGAVRRPGLVHVSAGSRVADVIAAAGGFGPDVDAAAASSGLHLAKPVSDGDEIRVPARGDRSAPPPPGSDSTGPIDLNTATEAQLDALPGVGPATVAKIVAARRERPFTSVDELRDRKIVGPATLEKLRGLVVVH